MIEDEIIHWWRDESGEQHRTILRLESERPQIHKGYPKDGKVIVRIVNTVGVLGIKLSPEEALRVSSQLAGIAKELMYEKRKLWRRAADV